MHDPCLLPSITVIHSRSKIGTAPLTKYNEVARDYQGSISKGQIMLSRMVHSNRSHVSASACKSEGTQPCFHRQRQKYRKKLTTMLCYQCFLEHGWNDAREKAIVSTWTPLRLFLQSQNYRNPTETPSQGIFPHLTRAFISPKAVGSRSYCAGRVSLLRSTSCRILKLLRSVSGTRVTN